MEHPLHEAIFDNLLEGVYYVDVERNILLWNRAAEKITGFKRDEVVGHCCADGILRHVSEDGEMLCHKGCPLQQAVIVGDETESDGMIFLHHKDGHRIPISIRVAPVRNEKGELIGAVEMFHHAGNELEQRERLELLESMAFIDELTGLPNRRYLISKIESRLDEYRRYGWPMGILFMDIDHFKAVNDTHGHDIGDAVLKMIAATLSAAARTFDLVGRWGGEEFVAVIANCTGVQLVNIAERFRRLCASSGLREMENLAATVSVGATCAQLGDTLDSILKRADEALYSAKESGRNRVIFRE